MDSIHQTLGMFSLIKCALAINSSASNHTTARKRHKQIKACVQLFDDGTADDGLDYYVGDQIQDNIRRWLSPPDPSKNYNIARKAHHEGSAEWFVHGNTFSEWKRTTGSLLWIHGKRASSPISMSRF